ncbi:MAG TPA: phosphonoacetaldehyde reductase [Pyrinomonadaceae bacterium]|nr:phosphonoacetaldehyde reductase [Pyrinomonadaceae bacterium]
MSGLSQLTWQTTKVVIGSGCFDHIAADFNEIASTSLVIFCGRKAMRELGFLDSLIAQFASCTVKVFDDIDPNPSIDSCQRASNFLSENRPKVVLALGGGSVIDAAKVANLAAGSARSVYELLSHSGPQELSKLADTFIAVPTTAGTGSEVTPFATVWDFDEPKKHSLNSCLLQPTHAYLDARLTVSLSQSQTQATAGDALGHAMESIWSKSNLFHTQALAGQAIRLIVKTLPLVLRSPHSAEERQRMLWASLLAGMAISQTRTAAAHAISYPLTLYHGIPHGRAVAALLPHVLAANLRALDPEQVELFRSCFGCEGSQDLVETCRSFLEQTGITEPLSNFGVRPSSVAKIARGSNTVGRLDNNIYDLSVTDIETMIMAAL